MELSFSSFRIIEILILAVAFVSGLFYACFMEFVLYGIKRLKAGRHGAGFSRKFVSVIIPLRNEYAKIPALAESLKKLNYPISDYEIIIVDDESTDGSSALLEMISVGNTRVLRIDRSKRNYSVGKKGAIEYGIENSSGEILLLTDADCLPNPKWISSMVSYFDGRVGFVSGPVSPLSNGGLKNKIFAMEQGGILTVAAGLIGMNFPVTCSGANVAYLREAFNSVNGYKGYEDVASGDDDLLMQKIFKKGDYKITYAWDKNALVYTPAASSDGEFLNQRSRWASKILKYESASVLFTLTLLFLFLMSFMVLLISSLIDASFIVPLIFLYLLKMSSDYRVLFAGNDLLIQEINFYAFFIGSLIHPFYLVFSTISGQLRRVNWKGRNYGNPHTVRK